MTDRTTREAELTNETIARYRVSPTHWPIVLSDWKRSDANVVITLRGGAQLGPGKVINTGGQDWPVELRAGHSPGRPERRWTIDLTEIAAIEAVAPR